VFANVLMGPRIAGEASAAAAGAIEQEQFKRSRFLRFFLSPRPEKEEGGHARSLLERSIL
jgi:hypothetical protein